MIGPASLVLTLLAALLAVPTAIFCVEIVASMFATVTGQIPVGVERRGRIAALVPAHNEGAGLLPTLSDLKGQLRASDRLIVVADNCTDDTAKIATAAGAEVTIRNEPAKIGKGYALDWGLRLLEGDPPDIVVMVDADCRLAPDAIDQLATSSEQSNRPVQALYLMTPPKGSAINQQVATFAWRVKNWVRPLGLKALGLPCQLMGTGMAFPWKILRSVELSSGAIVEDLKLGLDLASAGHAPQFCPSAIVFSNFPATAEGANTQRERWEHGHIGLIVARALPLAWRSLKQRNLAAFALALDLLVPPLSLLMMILMSSTVAAGLVFLCAGSGKPFALSLVCLGLATLAILCAWLRHARDILPLRAAGLLPLYMFTKLRLYVSALLGRKVSQWVRADRG
jgi:cellulose synthase/poly-beta-1,6-N-acetylglucosamine synthase-like glycosyltransferase